MTDAEISHKLALAIGYSPSDIKASEVFCNVHHMTGPRHAGYASFHPFDFRQSDVIWPIAKHYKCFPYHSQFDRPGRQWAAVLGGKVYEAAAPEMAVALAVIGGSK